MSAGRDFKIKRDAILFSGGENKKTGAVFFLVSLLSHGLFFFGLLFFQNFTPPKALPPVVQVDLVSFMPDPVFEEPAPAKVETNPEPDEIPVKKSTVKPKPKQLKHIKADISLKTKPKNLKDLMAKKKKKKPLPKKEKPKVKPKEKIKEPEKGPDKPDDAQTQKALAEAQEKLARELEEKNREKIDSALARLKENIKDKGKTKPGDQTGSASGRGKKGYKPIDLYHMVLGTAIGQNWVFNETLAHMDQQLEVRVLIKILKSGEIRDIIFETRSGNRYLDESAKRAIKKSNPLPQLPTGMHSYDLILGFTPKGLK